MEQRRNSSSISVTWRGRKFILEMDSVASLKELGHELQKLTDVEADTMRLIVPSNKSSKLFSPFSDEHAHLTLQEAFLFAGTSVKMMGVPKYEMDEVQKNAKADLRIAGFDEEEKRLRQRKSEGAYTSLTLPKGDYVFCDFCTLHLPGIELNPPASEALKLMHKLAADPGIVAIMNKHRWRVGIMTEMAPVGYVGVSPKCILGFNKNHGEEISLRLRTDDLKGFRKYESIKKTLLHELAHMVFSEHDANFNALDKQLNQEAAALDWTKSRSHNLIGVHHSQQHEEVSVDSSRILPQKLGGEVSYQLADARATSVAAAFQRLTNTSTNLSETPKAHQEPDPDDSGHDIDLDTANVDETHRKLSDEPDPDESSILNKFEPESIESESYAESYGSRITSEPDPDDSDMKIDEKSVRTKSIELKGTDDLEISMNVGGFMIENQIHQMNAHHEPDPDESISIQQGAQINEPDPDDQELQRINDPVMVICGRLQKAIEMLRSEVNQSEAHTVLQTLSRIIQNVIEHPNEMKFKRLRKANPIIQRNVVNYQAAMEILGLIGFNEDTVFDEMGKVESYLVLKRNDPGLLWLAKSSLESCIAY